MLSHPNASDEVVGDTPLMLLKTVSLIGVYAKHAEMVSRSTTVGIIAPVISIGKPNGEFCQFVVVHHRSNKPIRSLEVW